MGIFSGRDRTMPAAEDGILQGSCERFRSGGVLQHFKTRVEIVCIVFSELF